MRVWKVGRYIGGETDPIQRVVSLRVAGRVIPTMGRWSRRLSRKILAPRTEKAHRVKVPNETATAPTDEEGSGSEDG
jgi:hypothetical protein